MRVLLFIYLINDLKVFHIFGQIMDYPAISSQYDPRYINMTLIRQVQQKYIDIQTKILLTYEKCHFQYVGFAADNDSSIDIL